VHEVNETPQQRPRDIMCAPPVPVYQCNLNKKREPAFIFI